MVRPIYAIAKDIRKDWQKVNYAAKPYLEAMGQLDKVTDSFYYDSAESVIRYFLANAGTWKGETARTVKAELRGMIK